jgi:hypothetical protein
LKKKYGFWNKMVLSGGGRTVMAILFALIGMMALVVAVRAASATREFVRTAARAEGVVTALNAGGSHPEIQFVDDSGKEFSYPQGGLIFGFRPGDKVPVLYVPDNPAGTATICAIGPVRFTTVIAGSLATIFILTGAAILRGDWIHISEGPRNAYDKTTKRLDFRHIRLERR